MQTGFDFAQLQVAAGRGRLKMPVWLSDGLFGMDKCCLFFNQSMFTLTVQTFKRLIHSLPTQPQTRLVIKS
ncbi:hypothetical protein BG910_08940 [Neisseria chenwenguii]|uniref:Uncharacterized protein n=1 Tax=Neisseria chenwenguii TaxID=1853278 RepID=A0A220S372_9NEIS|nr:hypothetical protein BG910_08940 [Neisseria chenwenguii]ROV56638.1 hypothetical protein EGS38_04535 [Neisseria chenwenguii]